MNAHSGTFLVSLIDRFPQLRGATCLNAIIVAGTLKWLIEEASTSSDRSIDKGLDTGDLEPFISDTLAPPSLTQAPVVLGGHQDIDSHGEHPPTLRLE